MSCRRSQTTAETEAKIQEAINGIREGKFKSSYHTAKILELNPKTIHNHMAGGKSCTQAQASHQTLSPAEEIALV